MTCRRRSSEVNYTSFDTKRARRNSLATPSSPLESNLTYASKVTCPERTVEHCSELVQPLKRTKRNTEQHLSVDKWIDQLPSLPEDFLTMSEPRSKKRALSKTETSQLSSYNELGDETTISRDAKYTLYKNPRFLTIMKSKGSFMQDHPEGPLQEELEFCNKLFTSPVPVLNDPLWTDQNISRLRSSLQGCSELCVYLHLQPRLIPSSQILKVLDPASFQDLAEGHNDQWTDALPIYKKLPQPDRTKAYSSLAFTKQERDKLNIRPEYASWCTTREGWLFPYFTCEVKCGDEALDIADRANLNSMTIAQRIVVDLFYRANDLMAIHRRFICFSISHNDGNIRIYGHYPYIQEGKCTYWRQKIREFSYDDQDAKEKATTYTFVYNMDTIFADIHLKRLKGAISRIPDPNPSKAQSNRSSSAFLLSQPEKEILEPLTLDAHSNFSISPSVELLITSLTQQLDQQRRDFSERLAEQQRQSTQQIALLNQHIEQQHKEAEQQHKELMQTLTAVLHQN